MLLERGYYLIYKCVRKLPSFYRPFSWEMQYHISCCFISCYPNKRVEIFKVYLGRRRGGGDAVLLTGRPPSKAPRARLRRSPRAEQAELVKPSTVCPAVLCESACEKLFLFSFFREHYTCHINPYCYLESNYFIFIAL